MAVVKGENVAICNDPIMNDLQAIFDGKTTNLQHLWFEMFMEVIIQEKSGHFENALHLLGI